MQQRLRTLREERALNKTHLDTFLFQNGLSKIFNHAKFYDNKIMMDIIKYDDNRLNYTTDVDASHLI